MRAILVSTVLALTLAALSGCTYEQHEHYDRGRRGDYSGYYRAERGGDYHGYRGHRDYRYRDCD